MRLKSISRILKKAEFLSGGIAGMFLLEIFSLRANKQGYIGEFLSVCYFPAWIMLTSTLIGMVLFDRLRQLKH